MEEEGEAEVLFYLYFGRNVNAVQPHLPFSVWHSLYIYFFGGGGGDNEIYILCWSEVAEASEKS